MTDDDQLRSLERSRERLMRVLADVAADRVSREYGNSELADMQQEVDRLDREINALRNSRAT